MTGPVLRRALTAARTGWRLFRLCAEWCNRVNAVADRLAALAEATGKRR